MDLKSIVVVLITGVGIPLAVQFLKQYWSGVPAWVKTFAPVVLPPLLVYAGSLVSAWAGVVISFQDLIDIIVMTTTVGIAATTAFKLGKKQAA